VIAATATGCGDDVVEGTEEVGNTTETTSASTTESGTETTSTSTSESGTETTSTSTSESGTDTSTSTSESGTETTSTSESGTETTSEGGGVCGDGNVDPGEDCDDGNMVDDDACSNACALNPFLIEVGDAALDQAIPDDTYLGTLVSMACASFEVQDDATVVDVELELALTHTYAGDLTAKLVSPSGTVITLFSRPGMVDQADDGAGCCGESANLDAAGPLAFRDDFMADAETMGGPLGQNGVICIDDGICEYHTNPGSAAPGTLIDLVGEGTMGFWQVCVGDSSNGDTGTLVGVTLSILAG
jgi:cysteine-rich repeat protein